MAWADRHEWYLIEDVDGDCFNDTILSAATKEDAIAEAKRIWHSLTRHDRNRRSSFYIVLANLTRERTDDGDYFYYWNGDLENTDDYVNILELCEEE